MKTAILSMLLISSFGSVGCSYAVDDSPRAPVIYHGDLSFTASQRLQIENALKEWNLATDGAARDSVVWDGDYTNNHHSIRPQSKEEGMIVVVQNMEGDHFVIYGFETSADQDIWLVVENIPEDCFYPVILHELGHGYGLGHTKEKGIMYPLTDPTRQHLEQSDIEAFDERWGIK